MLAKEQFHPIPDFSFEVNRAERAQQVRLLVPLLAKPKGRVWFLRQLNCPCTEAEAHEAQPYHLAFPLRDLVSKDLHNCRDDAAREAAFIIYYNRLFGLPDDYGANTIWRTRPGGTVRHPAARGRSGWHRRFLSEYLPPGEVERLMGIRQLLDTEADAMLLLPRHVVIVECKYKSSLRREQHDRQKRMGKLLGKRLNKQFLFGLVVESQQDLEHARIQEPHVTWKEIKQQLLRRG